MYDPRIPPTQEIRRDPPYDGRYRLCDLRCSHARPRQDRGSEKDQEACTPDVFRLCQEFIPNEAPIVACLKAKHAELSTACSLVMYPAPTAADTTATIKPRATARHAGSTHSHKKHKHAVKSAG